MRIFRQKLKLSHGEWVIALGNNATPASKLDEISSDVITQMKTDDENYEKANKLSKLRKGNGESSSILDTMGNIGVAIFDKLTPSASSSNTQGRGGPF